MSIFYLIMANISSMKMHRVQNSKNLNARNKIWEILKQGLLKMKTIISKIKLAAWK
jgi:hypothetical protein